MNGLLERIAKAYVNTSLSKDEDTEFTKIMGDVELGFSRLVTLMAKIKGYQSSSPILTNSDIKEILTK